MPVRYNSEHRRTCSMTRYAIPSTYHGKHSDFRPFENALQFLIAQDFALIIRVLQVIFSERVASSHAYALRRVSPLT